MGKLMEAYTGPWRVTAKLKVSLYALEHCENKKIGKRHAAHLSPFPEQLLPFLPVDGLDNQYDQLYRPIQKDPYKNAGVKGFELTNPHCVSAHTTAHGYNTSVPFPTLAELNAEFFKWNDG